MCHDCGDKKNFMWELRHQRGLIFHGENEANAFKKAAKWLKENPEYMVIGMGHYYSDNEFDLHLFVE